MEALLTEDCTPACFYLPAFQTNGVPSSMEYIQKAIQNDANVAQRLKGIFG